MTAKSTKRGSRSELNLVGSTAVGKAAKTAGSMAEDWVGSKADSRAVGWAD